MIRSNQQIYIVFSSRVEKTTLAELRQFNIESEPFVVIKHEDDVADAREQLMRGNVVSSLVEALWSSRLFPDALPDEIMEKMANEVFDVVSDNTLYKAQHNVEVQMLSRAEMIAKNLSALKSVKYTPEMFGCKKRIGGEGLYLFTPAYIDGSWYVWDREIAKGFGRFIANNPSYFYYKSVEVTEIGLRLDVDEDSIRSALMNSALFSLYTAIDFGKYTLIKWKEISQKLAENKASAVPDPEPDKDEEDDWEEEEEEEEEDEEDYL